MKNEEKIFMLLLLAIVLLMALSGFRYSGGSKILPLVSGVFSALLMGFMVLMSFFPKVTAWYQKFEKKDIFSAEPMTDQEKKRERSVVFWFVGCTAAIYLFGFMVGIPLFIFLFLKLWAKESWTLSIGLALAVSIVVYVAFVYLLRVPLHSGLLFA
jgi:hypothetical protein